MSHDPHAISESAAALTDGAWRFDPWRRVLVWVAGERPTPPVVDLHELVACPTCHARVDQTCRTKSGHTTTPHGSRIVGRRCGCGADIAPKKRYCPGCAKEADLLSKRESYARKKLAA